jgi:hypothetical protein
MSQFQAILFDKNKYNINDANFWLNSHGYVPMKFHNTVRYIHARLMEPNHNIYNYKTINLGNKIKGIITYYKKGRGIMQHSAVYPHHYERLLRPRNLHNTLANWDNRNRSGGNLLNFVISNPRLINGLVGGIHALGSLAVLGGIGYAIRKKVVDK